MKNTLVIISSYGSCSYWKMTGPLTAGQPSKNFIFGHAHWIPLIEKWGKSLGKNNFPQYLPFQDALPFKPQVGSFEPPVDPYEPQISLHLAIRKSTI